MALQLVSSAIRVSYPAHGEMVVQFPRQVLASSLLLAVGLVLAFFTVGLIKSTGWKFRSALYSLGLLPLILALYLCTSSATLSFSRSSDAVVLTNRAFLLSSQHTYHLEDIDHAEVAQDDGASHIFYLALTSQDRVPVGGGWMPFSGYVQAANSVNVFLNESRTTTHAAPEPTTPDNALPSMEELGKRAISAGATEKKQAQR